jgi:hypothetical protein
MSDQKPKSTIRQLLESGPTDSRLMEKLNLLEQLQAAHAQGDQKRMLEIGRKLAANEMEFEAAKKQRRENMARAATEAKAVADPEERAKALLSAFVFCVKEACAANKEGQGTDTYNFGIRQLRVISGELRAMDRFPALAQFLDNADIEVRGFAAVWLRNIMPDRVLPILKEINKTEKFGSPVGTQVFTAIFELENTPHKEPGAKP